MGRHSRTGSTTEYRPVRKEGTHSHRKAIHVASTSTTIAVVRNDDEVVIAEAFVKAVKVVYVGAKIAETCEGNAARMVELVATQLHGRRGLPRWTNEDVETALDYLSQEGQISLPEPALAAS